jgi:polar amino acid transport system permease protein
VPELVDGFFVSMGLYFFALFLGLGLGIVLAVGRHYGGRVLSRVATGYIEFFRGTPLLAQILAIVFIPPALNLWLEGMGMAPINFNWQIFMPDLFGRQVIFLDARTLLCALALGLNSGAYQAEFFRGAMGSVSAGQSLAAQSMGLSKRQEILHIMLPQSLRRAIPAWSNEAVYLPKYTTLAYVVGVPEFFGAVKLVVSRTYLALQVYLMEAIIFLILINIISEIMTYIYNRMKIPGI